MQNIKKFFMTLALLLMAVGGAWAQSSPNVVELKVPAEWKTDESNLTAADLPGFKTTTVEEAQTWTGAPSTGDVYLIYAFDGNTIKLVYFNGKTVIPLETPLLKDGIFSNSNSWKFYYTAEPTEWDLTSKDGKNWILDKMPASNVELQVEYFAESNLFLSKDALADKANIAVTAGETTVEFDEDGKSTTTVTEGNTVTVKFTGKKVLGMKVAKKPESLIVNPVVGQIIGSDGKNYAYASLPTGVTAVAKICYVSGSNGLALALTDEGTMNWSTAQTTCAAHTPAITGGTWKLASKDDWDNMINTAGSHTALRDGFSSVGGTNMKEDYPYWSSTEDGSDKVWIYSFSYGIWSKNNSPVGYVRACLAF